MAGGCDSIRHHRLFNLFCSSSFVVWIAIRTCSAQTHESAFGEVRYFPLPSQFSGSTLLSSTSSALTLAAWSGERREILFAAFDSALSTVVFTTKRVEHRFDNLAVADVNGDGIPDLILTDSKEKTVACVLDTRPDVLTCTLPVPLPIPPTHILIGDYNNDKRLDILVYDPQVPGILPLIGNGKGRFVPGKIIAPDNAIGAAGFAAINDDNLTDLIVWDWVKSELHILYGVGRGRFIDQSVFPIQGEVKTLAPVSMDRSRSLDLLLLMNNPSEFQLWEGNDIGDFLLKNRIALEKRVGAFVVADLSRDGLSDIVAASDPSSLQVIFNGDPDPFVDKIEYAAGDNPQTLVFYGPEKKRGANCVVLDQKGKRFTAFMNIAGSNPMDDVIRLAAGVRPEGIVAGDFNRDGIADLAVANAGSRSVSIYWGRKTAFPDGPFMYPLPGIPADLVFHSSTDTSLRLLFSFPQTRQISYFTLDAANNSIANASITSEGDAQFLATSTSGTGRAEFVLFNTAALPEGNSLSFFNQLSPTAFIERTFRLVAPNYLLGASVADLNHDSLTDIIYAYRASDTSALEIGVAFGDSSYSMKRRIVSKELALPDVRKVFIWPADFDGDDTTDLLVYAGPPARCLLVFKGKEEGLFSDPVSINKEVVVEDRSCVQIVDVDGDGHPDIVVNAGNPARVMWYQNLGNCRFADGQTLASEEGMSRCVVADVNGDGVNDLAMTFGKKGVVKIINGRRLPFRAEETRSVH
jgi:hypothetical protein